MFWFLFFMTLVGLPLTIGAIVWYVYEVAGSVVLQPATLRDYSDTGARRLFMRIAVELFEVRIVHNAVQDTYHVEARSWPVGWKQEIAVHSYQAYTYAKYEEAEAIAEALILLARKWIEKSKLPQSTSMKVFRIQPPKTDKASK